MVGRALAPTMSSPREPTRHRRRIPQEDQNAQLDLQSHLPSSLQRQAQARESLSTGKGMVAPKRVAVAPSWLAWGIFPVLVPFDGWSARWTLVLLYFPEAVVTSLETTAPTCTTNLPRT